MTTPTLTGPGAICQKLLTKFGQSSVVGTLSPADAAQFGITTSSAEQWAIFATAVCAAESGFDPRSANTSDPGGSFGIFQYAHSQVPGGNAYDIDASIAAFVRDTEDSVKTGSLRSGILGRRFSTIGRHPDRAIAKLGEARKIAASILPPPPPKKGNAMDWFKIFTMLWPAIEAAIKAIMDATGKTHLQAAAELVNHMTPGQPNSPTLSK